MGIVVFLAVMGSIYQNLAIFEVSQILPSESAVNVRQLVAGTYSGMFKSLSESTRDQVVAAVISAMRFVWLMTLTAGAVTVILSCFLGVSGLSLVIARYLSNTVRYRQRDKLFKKDVPSERDSQEWKHHE